MQIFIVAFGKIDIENKTSISQNTRPL